MTSWFLDVQVREALSVNIPFVPAAGGHSPWSTIENGIVIDLRLFKEVVVDQANQSVIVKGGLLMKELQVALSQKEQFTGKPCFMDRVGKG